MNIKIELDDLAVQELRNDLKSAQKKIKEQVFRALTLLEAAILRNIRDNFNVMSGRMLGSVGKSKKVREESDGVIVGEIGLKGVPYAAIKEFGGIIKPKNALALTIPTEENMRRDGQAKLTAQEIMKSGRGFIRDGIMFQKKFKVGKGKSTKEEITPMFILKKSVVIPAKPFIRPAIAQTQDQILKNFGLFLAASFVKD
jgi:hypothetical protein